MAHGVYIALYRLYPTDSKVGTFYPYTPLIANTIGTNSSRILAVGNDEDSLEYKKKLITK